MKKILLSLIALVASMSINAQIVEVYKNDVLETTYTNTSTTKYKFVAKEAPKVSSITLSQTTTSLYVGGTTTLTATVLPNEAGDKSVTWSSDAESIATVSSEGVVTAKSAGLAIITVTANDGSGKSARCAVVVNEAIKVTSITLSQTSLSLNMGRTSTLTATVLPTTANDQTLTWSSDAESIATVSSTGVVAAIAAGTATITAAANDGSGVNAACAVTITDNLLTGKFSVSATKQVQFTKGNLYWDGTQYKLESTQIASSQGDGVTYDPKHVSHFFWNSYQSYQSGCAPYSDSYSEILYSDSDYRLFCSERNPLSIDGLDGLYDLTGGANTNDPSRDTGEWLYLLKGRTNAGNLHKRNVTVESATNCVVLAPDDYDYITNPLKSSYTLEELNSLGLVCLPAAGYRSGATMYDGGENGHYWGSTGFSTDAGGPSYARYYIFRLRSLDEQCWSRNIGRSIRLVRNF